MSSHIGQAQEVYAAGFVATCQIQSLGAGPDLGDADDAERSPRLALSATDHRGGHDTSTAHEGELNCPCFMARSFRFVP